MRTPNWPAPQVLNLVFLTVPSWICLSMERRVGDGRFGSSVTEIGFVSRTVTKA